MGSLTRCRTIERVLLSVMSTISIGRERYMDWLPWQFGTLSLHCHCNGTALVMNGRYDHRSNDT